MVFCPSTGSKWENENESFVFFKTLFTNLELFLRLVLSNQFVLFLDSNSSSSLLTYRLKTQMSCLLK